MAGSLTKEEIAHLDEFLGPLRIAVVATVGPTGMPQLTPNWFRFANGRLTISTTKERVKHRNLLRDGRLAACIYSEPAAADYVTLSGRARIVEDESLWPETQAITERYMVGERVEEHMRRLRVQDRVILSMTPERVVFRY